MNPSIEATAWEENCPDSLLDICTRYVLQHPQTYCCPKKFNNNMNEVAVDEAARVTPEINEAPIIFTLLPDLHLPTEICEKLFATLHEEGLDIEDCTAGIFADVTSCRLRRVNVRCSSITDHGLEYLLRHNLRDLDIHNCEALTPRTLESLNKYSKHLVNLNIGNTVQILPDYIYPKSDELDEDDVDSLDEEDRARTVFHERGYILNAPHLQKLCIRDLFVTRGSNYLSLLLKPLPRLTHLDLSSLHHTEGLGDLEVLKELTQLTSLVLHNFTQGITSEAVKTICQIKTLRHLDLSHQEEKMGKFLDPNETLAFIVLSLPHLTSLDISGTNLAGGSAQTSPTTPNAASKTLSSANSGASGLSDGLDGEDLSFKCDIPGLASRVNNPLEFLGLYKTSHDACYRVQIPAKQISGDANEKQILVAGRQYLDRPVVLENVLNDLFHIFRYENCLNIKAALDIILLAMDRHPGEKVIQISGSASLYYVVKVELKENINVKMKKKILATLLNGMFAHKNDAIMMRNGCLTLCQFTMPQDVIFDYERLVRILLYIVSEHKQPDTAFVQRAGIYLLNTLACQVDGQQKLLLGNLGTMEKMLCLIREREVNGNCDDVMETAWSCMWNVTDETPINCKRFLDGCGMQLFLQCKAQFPEKHDLLRNMMGLLGNVAEVPELRSTLMTPEFVSEFTHLLRSNMNGIEVSYNAAGVLAHMASDGAEAWTIESPSREEVLQDMENVIEGWDLTTKRNINYRSFEPILRLVRVQHTPQCQHWAVWALANLTKVDGKYCGLVEQEGGLSLLEELINSNVPQLSYPRVLELAAMVRDNVTQWKERDGVEPADESLEFDG
ncbi:hypothetical protein TCAL_04628 [Tigriopus californicus]|uniref:Protein zer-1 homolog n=2 Tax=Tigriopus californicus TaxID=6832 RepID=A0A553NFT2_TIGCA|nr:hypothetical protein TCAL_04628 [Tigriopus californicus]